MMRRVGLLVALGTILASCGSASSPSSGSAAGGAAGTSGSNPLAGSALAPARTLNILMRVEPPEVQASAVDRTSIQRPLFAALLGDWGLDGAPFPVLAQTLPRLDTDTWR